MIELVIELAILIVAELIGPILKFLLHALLMPFWLIFHGIQQCWPQRSKPGWRGTSLSPSEGRGSSGDTSTI